MTPIATDITVIVETATTLAGTWTVLADASVQRATAGAGPIAGSATITMAWGQRAAPGAGLSTTAVPTIAVGDLLRITVPEDPSGAPLNYYVVESLHWLPDERRVMIAASGLAALLARVFPMRGWEVTDSGLLLTDPGTLPPFNALPYGDRSGTTWPTAFGGASYVHDRTQVATGNFWMASDIAQLLLERATWGDAFGFDDEVIAWRIGEVQGDYQPLRLDLSGVSVGEALNRLFPSARGMTWVVRVVSGVAEVNVVKQGVTATVAVDLRDIPWITGLQIEATRDGYDGVLVTGQRPVVGITLWYDDSDPASALIPDGWTDDEATRDAVIDAASIRDVSLGDETEPVAWARWRINPAWTGKTWGETGDVGVRSVLAGNGDRAWAAQHPPVSALQFMPSHPTAEGTAPGFVGVSDGTTWQLLSVGAPRCIGDRSGANADAAPGTIILASSPAEAAALAERRGSTFLITLGVREWAPLSVWGLRPSVGTPASPRLRRIARPEAQQRITLPGMVLGHDPLAYGSIDADAGTTHQNDVASLQSLAADALAHLGQDRVAASWTWRGKISTTRRPGDIVLSVQVTDALTYPVNGWVVEVVHEFGELPSTTVRVVPVDTDGAIV